MNTKTWIGCGLGGLALVTVLAAGLGEDSAEGAFAMADGQGVSEQGGMEAGGVPVGNSQQGNPGQEGAQQALQGLLQIRRDQCQSGNQLACEDIQRFPARSQKLSQLSQACQSGDGQACGSYKKFAEEIFTAYSESAAVMRNGAQAMAQMDGWRAQMNANAANSMANLRAQGAAGQAAHQARQESYAAQNRVWQSGQDSIDRNHGRFVDSIYEGTTVQGGGVESRIPYGRTGYTDGYGNMVTGPEGGTAPDGWQQMDPKFAAPE